MHTHAHALSAALKYSGLTEAYRTPFPSLSLFLTKTKQEQLKLLSVAHHLIYANAYCSLNNNRNYCHYKYISSFEKSTFSC